MSTYRQLVYLILDEVKLLSDDSTYNEEHVIFLLNKYRSSILNQAYSNIKKEIPESNYQTICVTLSETVAMSGSPCEADTTYLKSDKKIPHTLTISSTRAFPVKFECPINGQIKDMNMSSFYKSKITFVSRERMRYVGYNKYLQNFIYASIGPDKYLYLTSSNPNFINLKEISISAIFENPEDALGLQCNCSNTEPICDILDMEFPLEEGLISILVQSVMKELLGAAWRPADLENDSSDNLSKLAQFLARNMKSQFARQLDADDDKS